MLNSISVGNIYLKPQMGKGRQNLSRNYSAAQIPVQNNFVYPSAENFKAIAFGSNNYSDSGIKVIQIYKSQDEKQEIKEFYRKQDFKSIYELINPKTPEEEHKFCKILSLLTDADIGTTIELPTETFGAKFHIALIEQLQLLKELNQPMPPVIGSYREPVVWNEEHTNFSSKMAYFNTSSKFIEFNVETIEASRELKIPEEEIIKTFINNLNHEMGHLAHLTKEPEKWDQGFEAWIDEDKRKTYKDFATLYETNYDKIKWSDKDKDKPSKDMFDLNVPYSMNKFTDNWQTIYHTLTNSDNQNTDMKNIFPMAKIKELDDIALKLYKKSQNLYELGDYAFYLGREAVAVGQEREMNGIPISKDNLVPLKPETREVLKELGKPDCPTFTYLPDDYFKSKEKVN